MSSVSLTVNGQPVSGEAEPRTHLGDFLREQLRLTGTHLGCEHGVCGACTVLIDGVPCRSCITYAVACEGAKITTIEGFDQDPVMEELRSAFSRHHGLQCGYCTPGMLVTAHDVVHRLPHADEARVREELAGNLCRCTGYVGVVNAITEVLATGTAVTAPSPLVVPDEMARKSSNMVPRATATATATAAATAAASRLPRAGGPASPPAVAPVPTPTERPRGRGTQLNRRLQLPMAADLLWKELRKLETVVACLPGAELTSPMSPIDDTHGDDTHGDNTQGAQSGDPFGFRLTAAIGPMRACFEGKASVHYQEQARTGSVKGEGADRLSRSRCVGEMTFAVGDDGANSILDLSISYELKGPLAHFSRGAVVEAVVDQLLSRFVANVQRAATGGRGELVDNNAPIGGVGLLLATWKGAWRGTLWSILRPWGQRVLRWRKRRKGG